MKRELPPALIQKQEQMRQQTIGKVLRAMEDLKAEGCRINIKNLMAYSGLQIAVPNGRWCGGQRPLCGPAARAEIIV